MVQVKRPNAGTDKIGLAARSICGAGCCTIPLSGKRGSKKGCRLAWDEHAGQLLSRAIMRTGAYTNEVSMEPVKVGIREFRERLAAYLLESDAPVAITRHGDTVGYFIPARRKRSVTERAALKEAAAQFDLLLAAKGITEDELVSEFKSRRAAKHR
jgi:PHD/YefM family antitoxin component YafN of YafNO toxin-antitoxin module